MGDFSSAKDCYEKTVDYVTCPAHLHAVYLRLADIYLRTTGMCGEHNTVLINFLQGGETRRLLMDCMSLFCQGLIQGEEGGWNGWLATPLFYLKILCACVLS